MIEIVVENCLRKKKINFSLSLLFTNTHVLYAFFSQLSYPK